MPAPIDTPPIARPAEPRRFTRVRTQTSARSGWTIHVPAARPAPLPAPAPVTREPCAFPF